MGAFLTALYTFRLLFIVFFGELSPFAREHLHKERFEGPLAMLWPVGVLAVLSIVGGFLQIPGVWHAVDTWLEPVVALGRGGRRRDWRSFSVLACARGRRSAASPSPGPSTAGRARSPPRSAAASRGPRGRLEHKLYFDEAYNVAFYEPATRLATWLGRWVEEPFVLRSLGGLGTGVRDVSGRVSAAQTGRVRAYVLALAMGLAVLAIVFLVAS